MTTLSAQRIADDREVNDVASQIVDQLLGHVQQTPEFAIWSKLKAQRSNPPANYVEDMVRSGYPLHKFIEVATARDPQLRQRYLDLQQQFSAVITGTNGNGGSGSSSRGDQYGSGSTGRSQTQQSDRN